MIPLRDNTPNERFPAVTVTLIVINFIVFFIELILPDAAYAQLLYTFGNVPAYYATGRLPFYDLLPFITSAFLHGGWMHIIGNMWFLWLFGDNVEDKMGHFRFLIFYLLMAALSGAADTVISNLIGLGDIPSIGASGAIAGVMGAYFLMFKKARVFTYIPPIFFLQIPSFIYLGVWIVLQLWSGITMDGSEGVGFWAHIGGFAAGALLWRLFVPRSRRSAEQMYR